jgi:hypothetical protein
MPPAVSEAASPGASAAGDEIQALLEGLNFAEIEGQFASGPELLGALGAQGNATLRDFLGRLKGFGGGKSEASGKGKIDPAGDRTTDEDEDTGRPLHGGPAREPFKRAGGISRDVAEIVDWSAEQDRLRLEAQFVGKIVLQTARSVGDLIKGQ